MGFFKMIKIELKVKILSELIIENKYPEFNSKNFMKKDSFSVFFKLNAKFNISEKY